MDFNPTINGTAVQNMIQISLSATTNVPTYFMKWFHIDGTLVGSSGQTTRRDINAMLVLDRSSSMQTNASCPDLINAALQFDGQFVNTRDQSALFLLATASTSTPPRPRDFRRLSAMSTTAERPITERPASD